MSMSRFLFMCKNQKDKFCPLILPLFQPLSKEGFSAAKSPLVDAPIINKFPICLEREFVEYQSGEYGLGVIGRVVNTSLTEGSVFERRRGGYWFLRSDCVWPVYTRILQSWRQNRQCLSGWIEDSITCNLCNIFSIKYQENIKPKRADRTVSPQILIQA